MSDELTRGEWERVDSDRDGSFLQRFMFPPPAPGVRYRVVREEWSDEPNEDGLYERTIHEIKVVS